MNVPSDPAFADWYADYLASDEWSERRRRVMERARYLCEGCLSARAECVHHTTYAHVGDELMFELVALCNACHEKAHTKAIKRFTSNAQRIVEIERKIKAKELVSEQEKKFYLSQMKKRQSNAY